MRLHMLHIKSGVSGISDVSMHLRPLLSTVLSKCIFMGRVYRQLDTSTVED